ncbi:MAG: hypothetical protein U1F43_27760 [Myxococcota bacterium]
MRLAPPTLALSVLVTAALAACGDDAVTTDTSVADSAAATDSATATDATATVDSDPPDSAEPVDTADAAVPDGDADADAVEEVVPPCAERPNAFVYPDEIVAWNDYDLATQIASLEPANHRGQDVVVEVGQPQLLVAKFAYSFFDKDMKKEDVSIWMQREPPCGAWEWMGDARTSDDGQYGTQYGIEDDGGRVFFEIPDARAFPVGRYPIRMVMKGDLTMAAFDLIVVAPGTQAVVTDIDGTLTTGDEELILELVEDIFNETYVQQMYPDADTMLSGWADKGYLIVYMTGRPDILRPMTERWVEDASARHFPPGPLHLTDTNAQAVPNNDGVGTYKAQYLAYLKAQGLDIVAAYGNATTDIYAYAQAGIPKEHTWIIGTHRGEENTQPLQGGYTSHLPTAAAFPAATIPAPPAFGWW